MNRYSRSEPVCHALRLLVAALFLLFTLAAARGATLVQDFYLPMPESQIYTANNTIITGTGTTNFSTFSIVVTGSGTSIYYDHWEDGYEVNLASPAQSTTLVWGDGNNANGICPGFTNDPSGLVAGTVVTLTNNVPLPRNPSVVLWDARDRVAATKALVISRAAWPIPTGPVFAGAVGVLSTLDYGTNYISPVGQNLTNNLFRYVGMFVMAAQNNTAITIDRNGNGVGTTNIVLNQGESYLINGGIQKGGRIASSKPVQADLLIGRVGASYASDWFTLYPVEQWDDSYYTPVASAASGTQPAYVYLFNPLTNSITINYNTRAGGGSFVISGTNGVYQFQMPIGSGASFTSAGGQNFFAISTVAANNTSDTSYNWGFTLVPKAALTTEATVGWGPGSADGTVNGSPVWVTTLAATTVYVDYKGDRAGPLVDPDGGNYNTNYTVAGLQSLKIYDPSKNQTGMRIYTVDGTLLTAAWGEDADVASPGNPYIDAGTTVLPFPVPVLTKTAVITNDVGVPGLSVGDTIRYMVQVDNKGLLPLGNTIVIDAPSTNLTYVTNSSSWNGSPIADSVSGTPFPLDAPGFTIPLILSRGSSIFQYDFRVVASGTISNSVNIGGTPISTLATIMPQPTNGVSVNIRFTDTNGTTAALYTGGANVFVTLTNAVGNTSSNSLQTVLVTVTDATTGDSETVTLTETGVNTGVFRNLGGLPSSTTTGLVSQDGTLKVSPGDTLSVSYTEPTYGSSSSATAAIQIPARTKQLYLSVNGSTNGVQALNRVNPVAAGYVTNRVSADIGSGGGTLALILTNTASSVASVSSLTISNVAVTSAANRLLLVSVTINPGSSVSGVTFGGQALSLVRSVVNGTRARTEIWRLLNPPTGTSNIVATLATAATGVGVGVTLFSGVDQTTPFSATNSTTGSSTTPSLTITSAANEMVFNAMCVRTATGATTTGIGQTRIWGLSVDPFSVGSITVGAASVTNSWSAPSGVEWATAAVSIKPATGGGGGPATNVTSFAQTPVFCSAFTMPSNNLVTITNFITVTNGSLTATPDVTARLYFGTTNFMTIANPAYSSTSNTLVWSGLLTSNLTIPSGSAITYTISNGVAGTAFHVDYDTTNKPSKITLPASTVITIDTIGVYDAPYPNGSLVTTPVAGTTLYVRAMVSDPFGSYDISGLSLAFTAPDTNNNFNVSLGSTNVVASDSCSKTYEYTWNTGSATGAYTVIATASEGTEGVTAVASTGVTTVFLDLGTPSLTEFTSGNNGSATNSYLANSNVCVRVTDLNRNTNSATLQSIIATVTSSVGDSEIVTLNETGTNTGVFATCITTSTNASVIPDNGTLTAPVGSILTVSYTDPTDASDSTGATATIQPLPGVPGLVMNKTILSPSGGQVGVGQPVVYNLQIVNVGSTTLPSMRITDTYSATKLSYSTASVTPNTIASGTLTWTNLGAFSPGQSTNITVTFSTLATGTATNSATANGSTATNSSSVPLAINSAAVNVVKVLLTPTNQPVSIESNVVFRITIQNVGNTAINYLPMQDTFSGAYYQYVSATIPPSGNGFGTLIWTNLASSLLATNAIITNDITMKVIGQGSPANNTATAEFGTDIFGNTVPTSSGSVGVTTAAAGISGHVYYDTNRFGYFTNGMPGLNGVTLQLFSDPNGDGNAADGALVQVTTTDSSGYYELLNLTQAHYVVVENHLPGYSSSTAAGSQLALNLTSLTVSTNQNFFDYQPSAILYSTFSGYVLNDTNAVGTNSSSAAGIAYVSVDLVQDVNTNGLADLGEPVMGNATTATNGYFTFTGITPGAYVLRETDSYGYYSIADSQGPNDNQIAFITTNGITSTNNFFFDRLSPIAVNDTNTAFYLVPVTLRPLTNDISPNGDMLTITNVFTTDGIVTINSGSTNLTFTPTNTGVATITYTNVDAHGGTSSAVITINVTTLADLAIGKSAAASVLASNNLTYTISITNLGPSGAVSVTVTDSIPAGATFVTASGNGVNNSGIVTWNLGTLGNDVISNLTLTVTAPASGSLTNVASIGSPTPDPVPTNNVTPPVVTTVTPVADVSIVKSGPTGALYGTNFNYSLTVSNGGPSTAASLIVTDSLPVGLVFVSATPSAATNSSNQVIWNLASLAANATSNLTLTVISTQRGSLTNFASGGSPTPDPTPTNNVTPPVVTSITNNPPVANPDSASMTENTTNTVSPLINDLVLTPGGSLTILSVTPTNGTASISGTNMIFTPTLNFLGVATIGYTITDNVGGTNSSVITITVTNIPPIANPNTNSVLQNASTNALSPLLNDFVQTPGGTLVLISATTTNGHIAISGNQVLFAPTTNFLGVTTVIYTITDSIGGTNTSTITINVINLPPQALDDFASTPKNVAVTIPVLLNDFDNNNNPLTIVSVAPTNGTAIISGTNIVFTPTNNFLGVAQFRYFITDGNAATNSAFITVTVTNRLPVAAADSASTSQNSAVTIPALLNDTDPDGDTLTIISVTPTNGTANISGTNVIFTPATNFLGSATIGYGITDNFGGTNFAVITINVTALADLAVIKSGAASVNAATNFDYTITVTNFGPAAAGSLSVTDNLPASVTFVSATAGATLTGSQLVWTNLGTLAANTALTLTVTVTAPVSDVTLTNFASGGSPTTDPNPTNNIAPPVYTTVLAYADIVIGKTGPTTVQAAGSINYTISVTNLGPSSASSVVVTDTLPASVSFSSASGNGTNIGGNVVWNLGTLAAAQTTNLTLSVIAPNNGTTLTNVANVSSPTGDTNVLNNVTPPVVTTVTPVADVSIVKSGPTGALYGTNFNYSLTVSNGGPSTAASLIVTDSLPVGLVFVSATPSAATNSSNQVIWNLASLAANATSNLTLTVISTQRGSLTNFASGGSPTPDPTPTNNVTPPVVTSITNNPPVANPDSASMTENTTNTVSPLINDLVLTPGGSLTILSVTPTNGTASISGTNMIFTPTLNFLGVATIGYTITDNVGGTNSSVITITVTNIPPIANPDSYAMTENTTNTFSPLVNDTVQTLGGTLSIISVSPTNGTAQISGTNVIFVPTLNFRGTATIGYTITDSIGGTNSSVITVNVTNIPPVAKPDSYSMTENTTNSLPVLLNDQVMTPGGTLSIISVSPTNGTANISGTNIIFVPTLNFRGTATIGYTITDGIGGTNSSVATVTVTNIPPVANPDSYSMAENSTNIFTPLSNDSLLTPGGTLSVISVSPTNGAASIVGGTNVQFIPTINFVGVTTIGYTITDGIGGTNSSVITVTVTNQAPVAFPQTLSTTQNTALPVTLTGSDPVSRPLTFIIVSNPSGGTLTGLNTNTGAATYTPTNNFTGTDTFVFRVNNGVNNSSNATITINVTPIADLLVQQSGPASGVAGSNLVFTVAVTNLGPASATNVVVTNRIDSGWTFVSASSGGSANGNLVTWTLPVLTGGSATNLTLTLLAMEGGTFTNLASGANTTPDLIPANNNGSLTNAQVVTTVSASANLAITKSAPANVNATGSITYTISITNGGPSTASGVIVTDTLPASVSFVTASGNGVNNSGIVTWAIGTLANGATSNLTVTVTAPASGSLTNFASIGSPTPDPTPTNNVTPPVVTTVTTIADLAIGKSGAAASVLNANYTYTLSVTNFGPSAAANFAVTDNLPAGIVFVSSAPSVTTNAASQVIWTNLGTLAVNATTNLTLTVRAVARGAITNIATVGGPTVDNTPTNNTSAPVVTSITNRPPLAVDDSGSSPKNIAVTIPVLGNDSDADGDALTIVSVNPTNGTANISGTNVIFLPATNFLGTAFIGYTITDGFGGTNSALITINVTNRAPVALNDSASTPKNVAVTIPVLMNDSDVDGDVLTITSVAATNGFASINGTNVVFTPTNNFIGTTFVGYAISDGFGGTASALITVTVTNRAAALVDDSTSTPKNIAVTIPALANDSDPDGDALTLVSVSPTNGTAIIVGTNVVFTPSTNFLGTATVGYLATDGFGATNAALITITVTNRAPIALDDSATTAKNVAVTVPVLANDSDPDGDALTIISIAATNGFANISGTNIVFTPTNNFLGTTFVGYFIRDNFGGTNSALIAITVTNRTPVAVDDSRSTPKNIAVTVPVLVNDSDADGDALTIVSVSPTNGTANISGTNVIFQPATNFIGTAFIGYTITDNFGGTNGALITVTVTNRAPVANSFSTNTTYNTAKALTLTGSDADGDALTFIIVGNPSGGTLTGVNTNTGAVIYTPTNNFVGADSFTFRVNDGTVDSALATVNITVTTPVTADLAVFKTGPTNGIAGSNLVYSITVTNLGSSAATNLIISDTLPAGFTFVSAVPTNSSIVSNVVNWSVFRLAANARTNFTLTARSLEGGTFTNFATAISDAYDPNPTNNNGTLTNSQARTVVLPSADVQIFKDGGTNVAAGGTLVYTITATNAGPSTATNVVVKDNLPSGSTFQTASGIYSVSNNIVTWSALVLTNGESANFSITMTAPLSGTFTNIALATASTPDPNSTNNNGSFNKSRVATKVVPVADLVVLLYGPTNAVQGSNFVYSLIVSNAGPSVASNTIPSDLLPTNFVFVSASSGGVLSNGVVYWPKVRSLAVGATTNYFVTVYSPFVGTFTNIASAISETLDPNPTNNTGVLPEAKVLTKISVAQFNWLAGTPIFNPQTGLYEETVIVTNMSDSTVAGFQLYVTTSPTSVVLWNATGTNGGERYVQYSYPLDPSNSVSLILEFYNPLRIAFTNTIRVVPVIPANNPAAATNGAVQVNNVFTDTRTNGTRFVIEFASVPGKTYTIIYSSDLLTWKVATPSVHAVANVTQWYDDGPPKTESLPISVGSRYYRVIKN